MSQENEAKEKIKLDLEDLQIQLDSSLSNIKNEDEIDKLRIEFIGKKGKLTQILKGLGRISGPDRAEIGKSANLLKAEIENKLSEKIIQLKEEYYKILKNQYGLILQFFPKVILIIHYRLMIEGIYIL